MDPTSQPTIQRTTESEAAAALRRGEWRRFSPTIERRWAVEEGERIAYCTRSVTWLVLAAWALILVVDVAKLTPEVLAAALPPHLLGLAMAPGFALLGRSRLRHSIIAAVVLLYIPGLSLIAKIAVTGELGAARGYEGLLLYVVAVYVVTGLPWRWSLTLGMGLLGTFLVMLLVYEIDRELLTAAYLAIGNMLGALSAWTIERARRLAFLHQQVLEEERERLVALSAALEAQAEEDQLTGLPNRRALMRQAPPVFGQGRRDHTQVLVAMVDVDHFKAYNDSLGHVEGDACLAEVGAALSTVARRPLDVVARYGGEEFAVVWLADADSSAELLGERILDAVAGLQRAHPASAVADHVTVSVGVAVGDPAEETLEEALSRADALLYRAKQQGRARAVVQAHAH